MIIKRLLLTGAAGGIAHLIHDKLQSIAHDIRYSDIVEPSYDRCDIDFVRCDLSDKDGVNALVKDCDGILHLGGISTEHSFDDILSANIIGVRNLYEAAQKHGQPRIFLASSNHVVGFYQQDDYLDSDAAHRPDSWYGVSKSFAEAVALMYFHKLGQETAMVRIGSCFKAPSDYRMLSTWLSIGDFLALVKRVFAVPRLGCPVIYGVSDNDSVWWNNAKVSYLGWQPQDSSAPFIQKIEASIQRPEPSDPASLYQGGLFAKAPLIDDHSDGEY